MDVQLLEDIGLTKGEIKVYLALLNLGQATTGNILDKADISGGKIYVILNKLIKKGLVSYIIKKNIKHFSAAHPNKILNYIDEKEELLKEKKEKIEDQLPSLFSLKNTAIKYDSQLYVGYEGIKTVIFDTLNNISSKDEILIMGINLSRDIKYNIMWKHWHSKRIKKNIACKMLFSENNSKYFKVFKQMKKTQTKILKGITPASIGIVGDSILITTYGEESSCLLIKHPDIVLSFKVFFNTLWPVANKT